MLGFREVRNQGISGEALGRSRLTFHPQSNSNSWHHHHWRTRLPVSAVDSTGFRGEDTSGVPYRVLQVLYLYWHWRCHRFWWTVFFRHFYTLKKLKKTKTYTLHRFVQHHQLKFCHFLVYSPTKTTNWNTNPAPHRDIVITRMNISLRVART